MTIHERPVGDVTVIDIGGRITVQDGSDMFREAVQGLVNQGRVKLVVNLHEVPYIDSTALGEIVRAFTTTTRRGGSLKLLNLTTRVHDLLALTMLLPVFDSFDDEAKALASFGRPPVEHV